MKAQASHSSPGWTVFKLFRYGNKYHYAPWYWQCRASGKKIAGDGPFGGIEFAVNSAISWASQYEAKGLVAHEHVGQFHASWTAMAAHAKITMGIGV